MREQTTYRLINFGIFIALVNGVLIVSIMDVSGVRLGISYTALFIGWIMAVAANQGES